MTNSKLFWNSSHYLGGGFDPSEQNNQIRWIFPSSGEHPTKWTPPPRYVIFHSCKRNIAMEKSTIFVGMYQEMMGIFIGYLRFREGKFSSRNWGCWELIHFFRQKKTVCASESGHVFLLFFPRCKPHWGFSESDGHGNQRRAQRSAFRPFLGGNHCKLFEIGWWTWKNNRERQLL